MILDLTTIPIRKAIGLMKHLAGVACVVLLASLAQAQTSKETPPKLSAELERVRSALMKYRDPIAAVRDGYFSTVGCIEYPTGGMGSTSSTHSSSGPCQTRCVRRSSCTSPWATNSA